MIQVEIKGGRSARQYALQQSTPGVYQIPTSGIADDARELRVYLPFLDANAEDEGYYVTPYSKVCFLTYFTQRENREYHCDECIMPLIGAKLPSRSYLVLIEGMRYDYVYHISVQDGRYSVWLSYDLTQIDLYEDIRLRVIELHGKDADYSGMARTYRSIVAQRLRLTPLSERVKHNEILNYAATDMPLIRIRLGWKPVPTPVLEQTPETEPPMHVACTFAQVEELMQEMKQQGIEKAEICLVGWNVSGHDGRWPQMFPVEEKLGGEAGLKQLIAHAKQLGYRITCHTNSSDAYHIADSWDEGDIVKTKSGALSVNENAWSGGRMYNLCPQVAYQKYFHQDMQRLRALGFEGLHYIDVITINHLKTCYDPKHPLNADGSARYLNQILSETQQMIGGAASEGGFDFAAKNLDFALYIAFNLIDGMPDVADEVIPLWQLVYSGYILSNPSAETVNYMVKNPENRLRFYEFGGIPTLYFFSRFVGENGMKNWMGDQDIYCATQEQRKKSVEQIKRMLEEYHPYARRRLAFMDEHRKIAPGVYESVYSDGYHVVVNYNDEAFTYEGRTIPAKDVLQFCADAEK